MKFVGRRGRVLSVGVLVALAGIAAPQQAYPSRPIRSSPPMLREEHHRIDPPYRPEADEAGASKVLVDNRSRRTNPSSALKPWLSPRPTVHHPASAGCPCLLPLLTPTSYDPIKDFAPVATLATSDACLVLIRRAAHNLRE